MAYKGVVQGMNVRQHSVLRDCSLGIEGTVTNMLVMSRTYVEVRSGTLIHTDVTIMSWWSTSAANYFFLFIGVFLVM